MEINPILQDNTDMKKKFIYNNISLIKDHTIIIEYFDLNKLNYTMNNNGIFINLSILDEEVIDFIYKFTINQNHIIPDNKTEYLENNTDKVVRKKKNIVNDIFLKNFTKEEQKIIKYSKQENL